MALAGVDAALLHDGDVVTIGNIDPARRRHWRAVREPLETSAAPRG